MRKTDFVAGEQQRHRPACTSVQSNQHLNFTLQEILPEHTLCKISIL